MSNVVLQQKGAYSHGTQIEAVAWPSYDPQEMEPRWRKIWEETGLYASAQDPAKPKYACLDFFPYPSGEGLHVGHCRNYVPTDVISRFKRMQGYNVLHPMGWDAFGEPAEQFAVRHNVHPQVTTVRNSANFRRQMDLIGTSYDWTREITSSDPTYYRWTQWFFLLLYKRGLAYRDMNWQWWCPTCQTTLSSHEAVGGVCWRGHSGVTKRQIPAWYFRITAYAAELLTGLDQIDWPESVKLLQRNWIGRSEGCEITFHAETGAPIPVFTTRPDTLYGVTYLVLAPEHPLVEKVAGEGYREQVMAYVAEAARQSEIERMAETRAKTGIFTGCYAVHPLNGRRVPIWIADYVLPGYGTGAVMGVPAHDQRDFEFARRYDLPLRVVVAPPGYNGAPLSAAYEDAGVMANSGPFDGLPNTAGGEQISDHVEQHHLGRHVVNYRMRDWLISRQRYWGTPIPIVHCDQCGIVPVSAEQLPVLLPTMEDFQPDGSGRSPLARLPEFVNTTCPACGGPAQRETDTMGGFACSSWYFLRYTSPHNNRVPFDPAAVAYWMPVDLYVGGVEHAVLHLLYARFWTQVMADAGLVAFREPFSKLLNQGNLWGSDGYRMSKSRGNVVIPDAVVAEYGADALRIYALFMAPFDQDASWNPDGTVGARRFLARVWNLVAGTHGQPDTNATGSDPALERLLHRTIRDVTTRIEEFRFNTMVPALMEFTNALYDRWQAGAWHTVTFHRAVESLLLLLAPSAPFMTEELWHLTGHSDSIHRQPWPQWEEKLAGEVIWSIPVQVNGRLRDVIEVPAEATESAVREQALAQAKVQHALQGREIRQIYYIPGKILNIITGA